MAGNLRKRMETRRCSHRRLITIISTGLIRGAISAPAGWTSGCPRARWEIRKLDISISAPGRIVYQDFTRINKAILDGELRTNPVIHEAFETAKPSRLHFIGLFRMAVSIVIRTI